MPDITQCPECQRKLNVAEDQFGALVRCPACGAEFTAAPYVPPRPAPVAPAPEPPHDRDYPRQPHEERDDDYPARRPPRYDQDYDRRYGRRYYGELPHRGSTVQTLGVLCLCFCWFSIACWVLGIIALVMASTDLNQMDAGQMDPSGRSATKSGQVCAIIGLIVSILPLVACCGFNFIAAAGRW